MKHVKVFLYAILISLYSLWLSLMIISITFIMPEEIEDSFLEKIASVFLLHLFVIPFELCLFGLVLFSEYIFIAIVLVFYCRFRPKDKDKISLLTRIFVGVIISLILGSIDLRTDIFITFLSMECWINFVIRHVYYRSFLLCIFWYVTPIAAFSFWYLLHKVQFSMPFKKSLYNLKTH